MCQTKVCSKCKVEKPLGEFCKDKRIKSRRTGHCQKCHISLYIKTDSRKKYQKKYYKQNIEYYKKYRRSNKKQTSKQRQIYRQSELGKTKIKEWFKKNRSKMNKHQRDRTQQLARDYLINLIRQGNEDLSPLDIPETAITIKRINVLIHRATRAEGG
jgi:hypothetical protein